MRSLLRLLACLGLVATLSGCLALPYPIPARTRPESRTNIPAETPRWIVAGTTTRRDVLLHLGEPDGVAPDGEWFSYGSARSHGGVGLAYMGGIGQLAAAGYQGRESVEYRHLLVRFDPAGRVTGAALDVQRCREEGRRGELHVGGPDAGDPGPPPPCVDIAGGDIGPRPASRLVAGDTRPPPARFNNVRWLSTSCSGSADPDSRWRPVSGPMEITRSSLRLYHRARQERPDGQPGAAVTLPFEAIQSVTPPASPRYSSFHFDRTTMVVERTDGSCVYVFVGNAFTGGRATRKATRELQRAIFEDRQPLPGAAELQNLR